MDLEVDISVMFVGIVLEDVDEDELVELDRAVIVDVDDVGVLDVVVVDVVLIIVGARRCVLLEVEAGHRNNATTTAQSNAMPALVGLDARTSSNSSTLLRLEPGCLS
eukprot:3318393-Amphidinium_carterae.1